MNWLAVLGLSVLGSVGGLATAGVLGEIDSLPMEYRWSTRAILLDPEEARGLLDKTRKKWRSRIRGFKDQVLRTQSGAINLHAQHMADDAEQAVRRGRSRRATFIKWLRKVHGWVGLWGAVLGLLFGTTGFLLNHRGGPLKSGFINADGALVCPMHRGVFALDRLIARPGTIRLAEQPTS